jgi:hypothetical protein
MKFLSLFTLIVGIFIGWSAQSFLSTKSTTLETTVITEDVGVTEKSRVRTAPFLDADSFDTYSNYNYSLTLFDSYDAARLNTNFGAPQDESGDIPWLKEKEEMVRAFPALAPHYLPHNLIHEIEEIDVTGDGVPEKIVYYSCFGCNAPARNVDIISGNKLIFSAQGGNLSVQSLQGEAGFDLSTLLYPRGSGYTVVTFKMNDEGEFHSVREEDFYYEND